MCASLWMRRAALILVTLIIQGVVAGVGMADAERPSVVRDATWQLRQLIGEDMWTSAGQASRGVPLPCDHTPVGPPPNPQVGDTWDWYIWRLNGFPQADLRPCTVRGMGPNCYVVVEDSQWNVNIDQAHVDTIINAFENESIGPFPDLGIWDINTTYFGDPPDNLDQDPRVYILYYDFDVASDGFFWIFDQECDDTAQFHSNECDVVYMNCSDFDPAGSYLLAVLAHEFEHLIHHNQDPNEASWVDEGLGELAMWLYGDPDNISSFNTNPDNNLTIFDGAWADYIQTYLWSLYFYERYGGQPAIRALIEDPANSVAGFENTLDLFGYPESFADAFSDWVVANYLDDTTIGDGRYGYVGDTLPPFLPFATWSDYPVGPNPATVNHWAGEYVRYLDATDLLVSFDGADNSTFAWRALLLDDVNPTEVVIFDLDPSQAGSFSLPQVGTSHDEAIMVHANITFAGGMSYTYEAEADVVGAEDSPIPLPRAVTITARPVGGGSYLRVGVPAGLADGDLTLQVFNVGGRLLRELPDPSPGAPWRTMVWDGRSSGGHFVGSGRYYARLMVGDRQVATTSLVLVH